MLFNSLVFALFFVVVYSAYLALGKRGQNVLLLVASYVFYGSWDWRFLSLIFASTVVDDFCGLQHTHSVSNSMTWCLSSYIGLRQ